MRRKTEPTSGPPTELTKPGLRDLLVGMRILIIEDVGMVAMALKSLLEELGCVVVDTAARLHKAEELARHENLDGVLLDLNLGGQFAYPVADILRERDIPFIIMSGYDTGQLPPSLAGAPYMQKPFERRALAAMILTELRGHHKANAPASPLSPPQLAALAKDFQAVPIKTRGEIESAVCHGMCSFEQEYLGRGPKDVSAHLIDELLMVRLQGVLTAAEQRLVEANTVENGRDLIKQVRTLLIETARKQIDSMIQVITGVKVISMHHDISTVTGEEIVVFTLDRAPPCRVVTRA